MKIVHPDALEWERHESPAGRFQGFAKQISKALGASGDSPPRAGRHPFDLEFGRLLPGRTACPFHSHRSQWELFVITAGHGTVRHGRHSRKVEAGDAVLHPPGEAHQLINTGPVDLDYFLVADNPALDVFFYPDSDKWGIRPDRRFFRIQEVDYWDGEDRGTEARTAQHLPGNHDTALTRFVAIPSLPWDLRRSPGGRFDSSCRDISLALGGERDTGTADGGHPFDLQMRRVPPGAAICPFHAHSRQWELFIIISGRATVRSGGDQVPVSDGDIILHPPGIAHQLTNTGDVPLDCYIIADNPGCESIYYPDSDKWMLKPERITFRMTRTDYFDGEDA